MQLAVDNPQKAQGQKQLQQKGVDQHQVPHGHLTRDHPLGGTDHDQSDPHGDNQRLADVEQRHGALGLDRRILPVIQAVAIAGHLQALAVEVFHRLIVDQRIDGLGVGLGVDTVHALAKLHAPAGHQQGVDHIDHHGGEGDDHEHRVVLAEQYGRHQGELGGDGQQTEDQIVEQGAEALGTPLDIPGQTAGLTLQVKPQGLAMQMLHHPQGDMAHGPMAHPGKDHIAQLLKQAVGRPQGAIGDEQKQRQIEHHVLAPEAIDDLLQYQGHPHIGQLRQDQAAHGHPDAPAIAPQIGQKQAEVAPVLAIGGG